MRDVELLTVADSFEIQGKGLVLLPDFSIPQGGWRDCEEEVVIITPSRQELTVSASFLATHFVHSEPKASVDQRYRVAVMLKDRKKHEIPPGSRVMVSHELRETLLKGKEPSKAPAPSPRSNAGTWLVLALAVIGVGWAFVYANLNSGIHREEVLDAFLRFPDLDSGLGALGVYVVTFWPLVIAVICGFVVWRRRGDRQGRAIFLWSVGVWLCMTGWYASRPSFDDEMEKQLLREMQERTTTTEKERTNKPRQSPSAAPGQGEAAP